jgi:hypothetical protein
MESEAAQINQEYGITTDGALSRPIMKPEQRLEAMIASGLGNGGDSDMDGHAE